MSLHKNVTATTTGGNPPQRRTPRRRVTIAAILATPAVLLAGAEIASAQTVSASWGAAGGAALIGGGYVGPVKDRADDGKCVDIERRIVAAGSYVWTTSGVQWPSVCGNGDQTNWFIDAPSAAGVTYGIRMRLRGTSLVYYLCTNTTACDQMTQDW